MPESDELFRRVTNIELSIEHIKFMLRLDISTKKDISDKIRAIFTERSNSAEVYLSLVDGPRTQAEIMNKTGLSQGTVSKICKYLEENSQIRRIPDPNTPRQYLYALGFLEEMLNVSKIATNVSKTI